MARQDGAPEAAKRQSTLQNMKFQLFTTLNKNTQISKNTRTRRRGDPKRGRPGEAQNPDYSSSFDVFVDVFGRPSSGTRYGHLRRLATPLP